MDPQAPDALHAAHYEALDAYLAAPDKPELKENVVKAATSAREAAKAWSEHQLALKTKSDKDAADNKPPEKYEFKNEKQVLNAKHLERIAAIAKEQGLSMVKAQQLFASQEEAVSMAIEAQADTLKTRNEKEWLDALKADKEIGGDKFEESGQLAYRAAEEWFGADFLRLIKDGNLNHHPALFKGLVKIAKANADDKLVNGSKGGGSDSIAKSLFPASLAAAAGK